MITVTNRTRITVSTYRLPSFYFHKNPETLKSSDVHFLSDPQRESRHNEALTDITLSPTVSSDLTYSNGIFSPPMLTASQHVQSFLNVTQNVAVPVVNLNHPSVHIPSLLSSSAALSIVESFSSECKDF